MVPVIPETASVGDLVVLMREEKIRNEARAAKQEAALAAVQEQLTYANVQLQLLGTGKGRALASLADVHTFPVDACPPAFTAVNMAELPDVVTAKAIPMLDVRMHKLVVAARAAASQASREKRVRREGACNALGYELPPLLTCAAVTNYLAHILAAAKQEMLADTADPSAMAAALTGSLSYFVVWLQLLLAARQAEIAFFVEVGSIAAAVYADKAYGAQNSLAGDDPVAVELRAQIAATKVAASTKALDRAAKAAIAAAPARGGGNKQHAKVAWAAKAKGGQQGAPKGQ